MQIRLITQGATATAIYNVINDKVRNLVLNKRSFTLDEAAKLTNDLATRTLGKLMSQMMLNDPKGSSSVNVSIINDRPSVDSDAIIDDYLSQQEETSKEEAPNYDGIVDPDTENFS